MTPDSSTAIAASSSTDIPPPPNSRSALPKEYDFFKVEIGRAHV